MPRPFTHEAVGALIGHLSFTSAALAQHAEINDQIDPGDAARWIEELDASIASLRGFTGTLKEYVMTTDQGLTPSRVEALALKVLLTDMSRALEALPAVRPDAPPLPGKVGPLVVSQRPHGLYAILDGNRRAALLRMTRGDLYVVDCQVYEGLTPDQETEIKAALNATPAAEPPEAAPDSPADRKPTPLDRFLARRADGDEAALAITRLAESLGWEISERQTTANIVAVASLERIYQGGDPRSGRTSELAVWQTLYVVTRAWGHKRNAVNGDVLLGVGLVLLREDGTTDLDAMIQRLRRAKGGPRALLDRARDHRTKIGGCTVAQAVADLLTP